MDPTEPIELLIAPRKLALLDIDGCVLNIEARLHHWHNGDYTSFWEGWETDEPIPQGVYFYKQLIEDPEVHAVFSTARDEAVRHITMIQLRQLFGASASFDLWMRPPGFPKTNDSDVELKTGAITRNGYSPNDIFIAFDDRNIIVEAYRKLGIVAYQTATGH